VVCLAPTTRRDNQDDICKWFAVKELVVLERWMTEKAERQYFIAKARPERARELLLFPRPNLFKKSKDLSPAKIASHHFNNKHMIALASVWRVVSELIDYLEELFLHWKNLPNRKAVVETLALNFGRWETRLAADPNADDCHAHLHIILTEEFVNAIPEDSEACYGLAALRHKPEPPIDYAEADCADLETHRLNAAKHSLHSNQLELLTSQLTKTNSQVASLEAKMDTLQATMAKMLEHLQKPAN